MNNVNKMLAGFNQYPRQRCNILRPEQYHKLMPGNSSAIVRGQGASYSDAALNENEQVILTERLNRFISFDQEQGILTAEAGTTLAEILDLIVPHGWFLPVTPGTQYVSLGGCIAADVHGKNHHHVGSFGQHVISFELIKGEGSRIHCSLREKYDNFRTALHIITAHQPTVSDIKTRIELLIDAGADTYLRDCNDQTALEIASTAHEEYKNEELIKTLTFYTTQSFVLTLFKKHFQKQTTDTSNLSASAAATPSHQLI